MTQRQPELARALEVALGEPIPPYGLQERIRRVLDERLAKAGVLRARMRLAVVAFAGLALGALISAHFTAAGQRHAAQGSVLTLRAARLLLEPSTELVVERDDERGSSLRLASGSVLVHVQKGTGRSFEVVAGETRVAVVGTIFGVSRPKNGATAVEVVEGVVKVVDSAGEHRLEAGQRWPAGAALFDDATKLAELRAPITVNAADIVRGHEPPLATSTSGEARVATVTTGAGGDAGVVAHVPTPSGAGSTSAHTDASNLSDQMSYTNAKAMEASGDRASALVAYEALSARARPIAEDALFSVLRLYAAQAEYAAALATVRRYRVRFPSGRYARDVDVLALAGDTSLGNESSMLAEADAFLGKFPEDPRAWRFRLARARSRAAHADCPGALADLARVPASQAKDAVASACEGR